MSSHHHQRRARLNFAAKTIDLILFQVSRLPDRNLNFDDFRSSGSVRARETFIVTLKKLRNSGNKSRSTINKQENGRQTRPKKDQTWLGLDWFWAR